MRISAPVTLGELYLARLLAEFASLHPALELDIVLTDQPLGLVETGIDIAIVVGRLADSSHVARKLAVMRCVLVAAPKYLDRQALPARIDDLAAFEFIRSNPSAQGDVLNFSGPDGRHSIRAQGRLLVNNGVALRELLLAGHGLAVMPLAWVHEDLAAQRLQTVLADYAPDALEVHALYPSARFVPTKLRALMHFLQEQLPRLPGWFDGSSLFQVIVEVMVLRISTVLPASCTQTQARCRGRAIAQSISLPSHSTFNRCSAFGQAPAMYCSNSSVTS